MDVRKMLQATSVFPWKQLCLIIAALSCLCVLETWRHVGFEKLIAVTSSSSLELQVPLLESETSTTLLRKIGASGTDNCTNLKTSHAHFYGLPTIRNGGSRITLVAGVAHRFWMVSYDVNGNQRCCGGDFYETDLSSNNWHSRPPIHDQGDGSYAVELFVDRLLPGVYTFKVILLFQNYDGTRNEPHTLVLDKAVVTLEIEFVTQVVKVRDSKDSLPTCSMEDFNLKEWSGRWSRTKFNQSCELDKDGRYRCFGEYEPCDLPWCDGNLSQLESNGWVYSAHCSFHIFSPQAAWDCLAGRRLLYWGDSNHQDNIRNMLNFVLGQRIEKMPRNFNGSFFNPVNKTQSVTITNIFNGHYNASYDHIGLPSMHNEEFRKRVQDLFSKGGAPDVVMLTSALHDALSGISVEGFAENAKNASAFWEELWDSAGPQKPTMLFRTSITPAATWRGGMASPQKIDIFNKILSEEFRSRIPRLKTIDAYDVTFPWHYNNDCNDGVHYGRPPALAPWFDRIGHYYFVDIMLVHIHLNAICPNVV